MKWTEDKIKSAVQEFINKNDRLPSAREYGTMNNLPGKRILELRYGGIVDFYKKFFPQYKMTGRIYCRKTKDEMLNIFIKECKRLNTVNRYYYDQNREYRIPASSTIMKIMNMHWEELLEYTGIKLKPKYTIHYNEPKTYQEWCNWVNNLEKAMEIANSKEE